MCDQYQGVLDPVVLEKVVVFILKELGEMISQLELAEVKIKIVYC